MKFQGNSRWPVQHSEMLTALHPCTRKQECKWPGKHCDPTGNLGTNLSALQKLRRKWHISSFQSAPTLCPSSKAQTSAATLLKSGHGLSNMSLMPAHFSPKQPSCCSTLKQAWYSNPTEPSMHPPVSLHPWHRSSKTTPPMLLICGCPGHKDKFYLVSKHLIIFNWSKSQKNISSQPRLKIIPVALL